MSAYRRQAFTLLPAAKPPWRAFGASVTIQVALLAVMLVLPLLMPEQLTFAKRHVVTMLAAPPIVEWKPQPKPLEPVKVKPEIVREEVEQPPVVAVNVEPQAVVPRFTAPVLRPSVAPRRKPSEEPSAGNLLPDLKPTKLVGSSAMPTIKRPREEVQTGGFGDPHGVLAEGRPDKTPNINRLGSYDLPVGLGYGNGTGGARGARGAVASAGFGNSVAIGGGGNGSGRGGNGGGGGGIRVGSFTPVSMPTEALKPRTQTAESPLQPVEILFKPRPVYTEAARQMRLEGEVLLEAVFTASGQVRVIRVVRGLGYGLDEAAIAAAQQIRFKPASRAGQPVDTTGIVYISFQLAY